MIYSVLEKYQSVDLDIVNKPEATNNCKQTAVYFAACAKDKQKCLQML